MDLEPLRTLLAEAERFYPPDQEPSIFAFGGRGYYENPTTDLLAFFLDHTQVHNLKTCFLTALLNCLPNSEKWTPRLREAPKREVVTNNNNRIDLVLLGDGWDLVLENKIFHAQANPFPDYEEFAQSKLNDGKRDLVYVVLSPSGKSTQDLWHGLSYAQFIPEARQQLAQHMCSHPIDKWQVFARDFLLHLENIVVEKPMDPQAVNFVMDHLHQIDKLLNLKERTFDAINTKVQEKLAAELLDYEPWHTRHEWDHGPAMRYASANWESETGSDVVLYLNSASNTMRPSIRVYLCDADEALQKEGRKLFIDDKSSTWNEGKCVLVFNWELDCFDEKKVLEMIVEKMGRLIQFETVLRPQAENP